MSVGPLAIVPFHVYRHDKLALADSAPSSTIRARSWLGPLTNATHVTNGWEGLDHSELARTRDGGYMLRVHGAGDQSYAGTRSSRLGFGIASPAGVLYWIGAGLMIAALVPRAERRARRAAAAAEAAFRKQFDDVGRLSEAAAAVLAPRRPVA